MNAAILRVLALVSPMIAIAVAAVVGGMQYLRAVNSADAEAQLKKNVSRLQQTIAEMMSHPDFNKRAAIPKYPNEQVEFLDWLRAVAAEAGVDLTRWSNVKAPAATPGQAANQEGPKRPEGIEALLCQVEVAGPFTSIRRFTEAVLSDQRLLCMSKIKWQRAEQSNKTTLSFTLARYVSLPTAGQAAQQPAGGSRTAPGESP